MSHVAIFPQHASSNITHCMFKRNSNLSLQSGVCFSVDLHLPHRWGEEETEPPAGLNVHYNNSCWRPDDCQQPVKVSDNNWSQRGGGSWVECYYCRSFYFHNSESWVFHSFYMQWGEMARWWKKFCVKNSLQCNRRGENESTKALPDVTASLQRSWQTYNIGSNNLFLPPPSTTQLRD